MLSREPTFFFWIRPWATWVMYRLSVGAEHGLKKTQLDWRAGG